MNFHIVNFFLGLIFRVFLAINYDEYLTRYYNSFLVVGSSLNNDDLIECSFLLSKHLPLHSRFCQNGYLPLFLNILQNISKSHLLGRIVLSASSTFFQILTTYILYKVKMYTSNSKDFVWYFFWMNPLIILSSIMSPIPSIYHFLLILTYFSAENGCYFILSLALITIISSDLNFIVLIPVFLRHASYNLSSNFLKTFHLYFVYTITISLVFCATLSTISLFDESSKQRYQLSCDYFDIFFHSFPQLCDNICRAVSVLSSDLIHLQPPDLTPSIYTRDAAVLYTPSATAWWYLEALLPPAFSLYYSQLIRLQPFLFLALCDTLLVSSKDQARASVVIMVAVVYFFRRESGTCDAAFCVILLLLQSRLTGSMRHKAVCALGACVAAAVGPSLLHAWTCLGAVNANYLFWSSLVLSACWAATIVEAFGVAVSWADTEEEEEVVATRRG